VRIYSTVLVISSNLFLINPAGFVFGSNAKLELNSSFAASTANSIGFGEKRWFESNAKNDYRILDGDPISFAFDTDTPGSIVNAGDLQVNEGNRIELAAGTVINTGAITADSGTIKITAIEGSSQVRISSEGSPLSLIVEPPRSVSGEIQPILAADLPRLLANASTVNVQTNAGVGADGLTLNNSSNGIRDTSGVVLNAGALDVSGNSGGYVRLTGPKVGLINTSIDASGANGGGEVVLGLEHEVRSTGPSTELVFTNGQSSISVDAINGGDGGTVDVWANRTGFSAFVSARGGSGSGNGGFVSISGGDYLAFNAGIDTTAIKGNTGTLTLDPENIIVQSALVGSPSLSNFDDFGDLPLESKSLLNARIINAAQSNVILRATNDITFEASVELADFGSSFTAEANNNIFISNGLTLSTSNGDIGLFADGTVATQPDVSLNSNGGDIEITAADVPLDNTSVFTGLPSGLSGGDVNLAATSGDIVVGDISSGEVTLSAVTGAVTVGDIQSGDGDLTGVAKNITVGNLQTDDVNLSTTAGNIVVGNIQSDDVSLIAGSGNITVGDVQSDDVGLSAAAGEITVGDLQSSEGDLVVVGRGISVGNIQNNSVNLSATMGDVIVGDVDSVDVVLTSVTGNLTTGDLDLSASGGGGDVNITAAQGSVRAGSIDTSGVDGSGGNVDLQAGGPVYVESINSSGLGTGLASGGDVNLSSSDQIEIGGEFAIGSGEFASIFSTGDNSSGDIQIQHGGGGLIEFTVASPSVSSNGSASSIVSGNSKIFVGAFPFTTRIGNISLVSVNEPAPDDDNEEFFRVPDEVPVRIPPLEDPVYKVEENFTREYEKEYGLEEHPILTTEEVRQRLRQAEADTTGIRPAVVYSYPISIDGDTRLQTILVTGGGLPHTVLNKKDQDIDSIYSAIVDFTASVSRRPQPQSPRPGEFSANARSLYNWLVAPLSDELDKHDINHLIFVVGGILRRIPFAALQSSDGYLVDDYSVGVMPSLSLTDTDYKGFGTRNVISMGSGTFKGDDPPLACAEFEIEQISSVWGSKPNTILRDKEFTISNVSDRISKSDFVAVHMATHANFQNVDSEYSYVSTHDGKLHLQDFKKFGFQASKPELITLSACETAVGEAATEAGADYGFSGFAAVSGVKSVIGSYWPVDDFATTVFMTYLHNELARGAEKAVALQSTQKLFVSKAVGEYTSHVTAQLMENQEAQSCVDLLDNIHDIHDPFFWSAFTLVGSPW